MGQRGKPVPRPDPMRRFPYYMIQVWNNRVSAWQDIQKRFESLQALHCFAIETLAWTETT